MKLPYHPAADRYDAMPSRRCGRHGLCLPALSLGLWQGMGDASAPASQRELLTTAFDLGITHFDLANNYGPPNGSAEINVGRLLRDELGPWRDELTISTKAGGRMWPGPHGLGGGSRKHLLASLDQSLKRLGLEYVDIFHAHRIDKDTPLEETAGALAMAVRQGKALYVGVSGYTTEGTAQIAQLLQAQGVPLLVHQTSYSLLNRAIENGLMAAVAQAGAGCTTVTALAEGVLSNKYLSDVQNDSVAAHSAATRADNLSLANLTRIRALNVIAQQRGQTLSQMALAWVLRDPRISSTVIAASSANQIRESVGALRNLQFSAEELVEIDHYAPNSGYNPWRMDAQEPRGSLLS